MEDPKAKKRGFVFRSKDWDGMTREQFLAWDSYNDQLFRDALAGKDPAFHNLLLSLKGNPKND